MVTAPLPPNARPPVPPAKMNVAALEPLANRSPSPLADTLAVPLPVMNVASVPEIVTVLLAVEPTSVSWLPASDMVTASAPPNATPSSAPERNCSVGLPPFAARISLWPLA